MVPAAPNNRNLGSVHYAGNARFSRSIQSLACGVKNQHNLSVRWLRE